MSYLSIKFDLKFCCKNCFLIYRKLTVKRSGTCTFRQYNTTTYSRLINRGLLTWRSRARYLHFRGSRPLLISSDFWRKFAKDEENKKKEFRVSSWITADNEWHILGDPIERIDLEDFDSHTNMSVYFLVLHVTRSHAFYTLTMAIPILLIAGLAPCGMILPSKLYCK